jgi:hypothetical protein
MEHKFMWVRPPIRFRSRGHACHWIGLHSDARNPEFLALNDGGAGATERVEDAPPWGDTESRQVVPDKMGWK